MIAIMRKEKRFMKRKRHQLMSMAVIFAMLLGLVSAMIPNQLSLIHI